MNNISIHNEYHFELFDTLTKKPTQVLDCTNLVTDNFRSYLRILTLPETWMTRLHLGSGTGVPSTLDTALFHSLGVFARDTDNTTCIGYTITQTINFKVLPAEAIGVLTEFGLGNAYATGLFTHALFTDAEGNPITINKKATDILYITAIVKYTISDMAVAGKDEYFFTSPSRLTAAIYSEMLKTDYALGNVALTAYASLYKMKAGINLSSMMDTISPSLGRVPATNGDGTFSVTNLTLPYTSYTTYGGSIAHSIKSIIIKPVGIVNITPEIFPPQDFPKYQLGVGDGLNKEFYNKTQNSVDGTQKVYVDGVLQTEGVDYTYHPDNARDCPQELAGANAAYATCSGVPKNYNNSAKYGPWYPAYHPNLSGELSIDVNKPITYDFQTPIEVNAIYLRDISGFEGTMLQYSNDGTNWTTVVTLTAAMKNINQYFDSITARYWRWAANTKIASNWAQSNTSYLTIDYVGNTAVFIFGYIKPNVVFTTAPVANAVIEIEYKIPYPVHNNLHTATFGVSCKMQS